MTWTTIVNRDNEKESVCTITSIYSNGIEDVFEYTSLIDITPEAIASFAQQAKAKLLWYLDKIAYEATIVGAIQAKLNEE